MTKKVLKSARAIITTVVAGACLLALPDAAEAKCTIKYGTIAPKGTTWVKMMVKARNEIQSKSSGKIKFCIYAGGTAGSEATMVRKLKIGSLDMAAFTGIGLQSILPQIRVLELPFFFKNSSQVDKTVKALYSDFEQGFAKKGYILAGVAEAGDVYLMSKKPIRSYKDMVGLKSWLPKGDKMVKAMFREYGLVPVSLSFESVLPQLQSGGLDVVYAPPVGAIGLQWFREVKYISNVKLANATGATLIRKKSYDKLSPDLQKILKETSEKYAEKLVKQIRRDNRRALKTLQKRGLKLVEVDKKDLADLKKKAAKIQNKLAGNLYSKAFLNKAKAAR